MNRPEADPLDRPFISWACDVAAKMATDASTKHENAKRITGKPVGSEEAFV